VWRYVDGIYRIELEIAYTIGCSSYLYLHLEIDSEGGLRMTFYDKRDDLNFLIMKFPFVCSNIPAAQV